MSNIHIIWSFNGGGTRGAMQARVVQRLEERLGTQLASISGLKHYFIGTSTGAIIALALTKPKADGTPLYGGGDILNLYYNDSPTIFPKNFWRLLLSLVVNCGRYPASGIESVFKKYLGSTTLGEHLHNVIVPATQTGPIFQPFFFKNYDEDDAKRQAWFVCRASTAAPQYFPPLADPSLGPDGCFIDGGIEVNAPAISGLAEAMLQADDDDEFIVVSFGTGKYLRSYSYKMMSRLWIGSLLNTVLDMLTGGQGYIVDYQLKMLMNKQIPRLFQHRDSAIRRYFNFDTMIPPDVDAIDDTSKKTLDKLVALADDMVDVELKDDFDALCKMLKKIQAGTFSVRTGV
jgi:patatin-like phospholipase/acyl hydrolase